ncbi:MAG: hypothetical protein JEZ01_14405 [Labilibaculum sp.]|nr:hypothetical protein [Labilibaculum sp.]MBI9058954.1 hypothetical protein [Labilibaculum sp.]
MKTIIRNIVAVLVGLIVGSAVNMGVIMISGSIIPPPEGVDLSNVESLKANMHLFEFRHFIMPFVAHAFGTFAGALLAGTIAVSHKMKFAIVIGLFFLAGGITNVFMLPSPVWFTITDLVGAYIPMAWLASLLFKKKIS